MAEGFLTREQLRYIRRSSKCKLFKPEQIFPMIDIVYGIYQRQKNGNVYPFAHRQYESDLNYILACFPCLEVHSYAASLDPKYVDMLYRNLENFVERSKDYEMNSHNLAVIARYRAIQDFIPLVKSQITLTL